MVALVVIQFRSSTVSLSLYYVEVINQIGVRVSLVQVTLHARRVLSAPGLHYNQTE